ncbi:MAG: hypothetical protein RL641_779 [Candidatus Parcubacteria bacterium]|jgi:hypothetical protein
MIKPAYCPVLNEYVVFNSKGFRHLRYDTHGKPRNRKEQLYKLQLLRYVVAVIKKSSVIYDYKKEQYSHPLGKYYEIWELQAKIDGISSPISVILRRIGTGNIAFLSVWKNKK